MAKYTVKSRVYCMGRLYQIGDECDENVARALGSDAELVAGITSVSETGGALPVTETKPLKKASLKSK